MAHLKLLDDPETCVDDLLAGLEAAFPRLRVLPDTRAVVQVQDAAGDTDSDTVGLISGGGAGHEPFAAGFVGSGMLSAAVSGSVFASPPATHVLRALKHVARQHKAGVLLVIPNYTGDCLNFGLALEWAKRDGIPIKSVVVAEDCALLGSGKGTTTGRRGMCGLVFVFKICGQLASEGLALEKVAETAQCVIDNMATMGLAIKPCTLPGSVRPLLSLDPGKVELGVGVHGEAGARTITIGSATELISEVIEPIHQALRLKQGDQVAVLVNNLGGLSQLEQWVAAGIVCKQIQLRGVKVMRLYCAPIMTSLETAGLQVCVLKITDEVWLRCLDGNTSAPAWPGCSLSIPSETEYVVHNVFATDCVEDKEVGPALQDSWAETLKKGLEVAAKSLIKHADKMNELDSGCGDGDCGSTLARLAKGLLNKLPTLQVKYPAQLLRDLAGLSSTIMGGTSGAVYGLFFSAASSELRQMKHVDNEAALSELIGKCWEEGVKGIMRYSSARRGDRTMLDALIPACEEFQKLVSDGLSCVLAFDAAVCAARKGCNSTSSMSARVGRASYVNEAHLQDVDAGAFGVFVWLDAFNEVLK